VRGTVLIVDDEVQLVRHLEHILKEEGYQVVGVHDAAGARSAAGTAFPDVVLLDLKLPDADGTALMQELQELIPPARYIIITAHGSIRSAVEATRRGASDYLTKPFEPEELILSVGHALRDSLKDEEIRVLRESDRPVYPTRQPDLPPPPWDSRYPSEAMRATMHNALHAASTDSIVLLLGESGSGKDFFARFIHDNSKRADGPFFAVNCAAVSPELAESELFGHEPGSFTGARGRKRGLLELAEGGTLLLNEIGELTPPLQAKLLTFLDTWSFTRVGGENNISVNARLIAATNRDLKKEMAQGRFREDLFYRLNVLNIKIPPLRRRIEDLPTLVNEIMARLAAELQLPAVPTVDPATAGTLAAYNWPGNVRELRNVLERALMVSDGRKVRVDSLGLESNPEDWSFNVRFPKGKTIHDVTAEVKRSLVSEALRRAKGVRQDAARMLGVSRHALAHQIKSLGIKE
jgi:DNA-binding NtrC family response regulator